MDGPQPVAREQENSRHISVDAVEGGWLVNGLEGCEDLLFLSGGRAEHQAHALAQCLAALGYDTRVEIHDRTNALAGDFRYAAQ